MQKYFNTNDVENFKKYVKAKNKEEKDKIYTVYLYPFIDRQINAVMKSQNLHTNNELQKNFDDLKQQLHIYIYDVVLPYLRIEKIIGVQNYIYLSAKNHLLNTLGYMGSRTQIKYDKSFIFDYDSEENEALIQPESTNNEAIIKLINSKIDEKIKQQTIINSPSSVYLQLLKQYIIDNNYNSEGFDLYVMEKMKIKKSTYLNLSHSFGFRTISFKTRIKK